MANAGQGRGREEVPMSPGLRVIGIRFKTLRASALRSQSRGPLSWPHLQCFYFCPGDSSCSCLLLHCVSGMEPTSLVTSEARGMWQGILIHKGISNRISRHGLRQAWDLTRTGQPCEEMSVNGRRPKGTGWTYRGGSCSCWMFSGPLCVDMEICMYSQENTCECT